MKLSHRKVFLTVLKQDKCLCDMSQNGFHLIKRKSWQKYFFEYDNETCYEYKTDCLIDFFSDKNQLLIDRLLGNGWIIVPHARNAIGFDIIKKLILENSILFESDELYRYKRVLRFSVQRIIPFLFFLIVTIDNIWTNSFINDPIFVLNINIDLFSRYGMLAITSFYIVILLPNIVTLRQAVNATMRKGGDTL